LSSKETFGVEREHLAGRRGDQRIDLHHRGVGFPEACVEIADELGGVLGLGAGEAELEDQLAHLEVGQTVGRVDEDLGDLLGRLVGHFLDFNAALGRSHDHGARSGAVEEDREVVLLFDVARGREVDRLHLAAGGTGLHRDQRVAEHLAGDLLGVLLGLAELRLRPCSRR
jgi:hypothetical protein